MNRSSLMLIAALLAGCNTHSNDQDDVKVAVKGDGSGNIAFDVPFAKGQVKVPGGMMHAGDVDIDGVKLMPGSKMTGFNVDAGDKGSTVVMSFVAAATPDQVRSYYLDQFRQKGVDAALSGDGIAGKSDDGDHFVIHVSPAQTGSTGKIEIQSKD